ncbi:Histidine-specific methyltransferase SAM-dependent [Gracilaria domingensis]|nr:Histidine-specific methyltransferase SAM-dependent [Gracilaria domingensis]
MFICYQCVWIDIYADITELEEYYLTGCEMEILRTQSAKIVKNHFKDLDGSQTINIIELGAGDGRKIKVLLEVLIDAEVDFEYIPVDISRRAMELLFKSLGHHFEDKPINVHGIVGEYVECVQHVVSSSNRKTVVLFLGSSLGNFSEESEAEFLRTIRNSLKPGDLFMVGTDIKKDPRITLRAYSDSLGVTRDFNLNLLTRMNQELNMDFNRSKFIHYASYDPIHGAALSFLISTEAQTVSMKPENSTQGSDGSETLEFNFEAYEAIHTETSRKYTVSSIHKSLESAGFDVEETYFDSRRWFADSVAAVSENSSSG